MDYTNTSLLNSIKDRAFFPIGQDTFQDADILRIASEVIESELLPRILQSRQEFYVTYETMPLSKNSGDIHSWIRIPTRAVGQSIIGIKTTNAVDLSPADYWVEGNKIYFWRPVQTSYRVYYYLRPGKLVRVSECAKITSIDAATGVIQCASIPSSFSASVEMDFVRVKSGFDTLAINVTPTGVTAGPVVYQATFNVEDLPTELAIGDYISLADESPIPQIPVEWFSYLALLTAVQILESLGEVEAAKIATQRLQRIEKNALSLISPRVEKRSKAILPPNY